MKRKLLFISAAFGLSLLLAFRLRRAENFHDKNTFPVIPAAIRCGVDWATWSAAIEESDIPPIPGAGIYTWKISTTNDSAQFYFNQGINMYYSFHIIEAMASFKKAARFDPQAAMLYWAQALTYGPNINDLGYAAPAEARLASQKALELGGNCTEKEKMLIALQILRYPADTSVSRQSLNHEYSEAMHAVYEKFPDDPDVAALYADAMMLEHPWDLWTNRGLPKPWTPTIETVLEKLLSRYPDHPGGNHYYIHVMEPSPFAAKALPSADRLGKTNPGLSHVVHMPSHIYLRTGRYNQGVAVNLDAVKSYRQSIPLFAAVTGADFLYLIHNLHMQTNNAMLAGNYAESRTSGGEVLNSIPQDYLDAPGAMGNLTQYISMTPLFVAVRFGKWDEVLAYPQPAGKLAYANLLYHFARGIAFSRRKERDLASNELDRMRVFMKDSVLLIPPTPFSPAIEGARVAEQILLGVIHQDRGLKEGAIRHFAMADSIEAGMVYNEPRDWLLNPKQYLGQALYEAGKWKEAEKVFGEDLKYNNENGWSLFGLYQSLAAQGRNGESKRILARFRTAFSRSDIKIAGAVY